MKSIGKKDSPLIALVCTGLGTVNRGFESYIAALAELLYNSSPPYQSVTLTGGKLYQVAFPNMRISNISRKHWLSNLVTKDLFKLCRIEQVTFTVGLLWWVWRFRPTAVYLGEYQIYCYLYKFRKLTRLKFSLALYTGGQAIPGSKLFQSDRDFIHHISPEYWQESQRFPASRQWLVPHFVRSHDIDYSRYAWIREKANGRIIVLSVGSLDESVKRMQTLVNALGTDAGAYFPILLGESSPETNDIFTALNTWFGSENYVVGKVAARELGSWYAAADLMVLGSPKESFGLVLAEAMQMGTPVVCQPFAAAGFVTGGLATYIREDNVNGFKSAIAESLEKYPPGRKFTLLRNHVIKNFALDTLDAAYFEMMGAIVENRNRDEESGYKV